MDKPELGIESTGSRRTVAPAVVASNGSGAEAYARWLEHMQRTRTRHAAITRNLYTWSNYKSWADKVRDSWKAEPDSKKDLEK